MGSNDNKISLKQNQFHCKRIDLIRLARLELNETLFLWWNLNIGVSFAFYQQLGNIVDINWNGELAFFHIVALMWSAVFPTTSCDCVLLLEIAVTWWINWISLAAANIPWVSGAGPRSKSQTNKDAFSTILCLWTPGLNSSHSKHMLHGVRSTGSPPAGHRGGLCLSCWSWLQESSDRCCGRTHNCVWSGGGCRECKCLWHVCFVSEEDGKG